MYNKHSNNLLGIFFLNSSTLLTNNNSTYLFSAPISYSSTDIKLQDALCKQ